MGKTFDIRKRTYEYALSLISFLETLPKDYTAQILGRQLLRSATSVGANIIEAQSASSKRDFAHFYQYSLKSANESKFWLMLLKDSKASNVDCLLKETNEISNILAASILTMKGKRGLKL